MSLIKSSKDLSLIRIAGQKLAEILEDAKQFATIGVNLLELEKHIHDSIQARESTPSFLGYEGYPNASCLSLNNQVVHGIPRDYALQDGDILGIDVGLWYKGVCVDGAITVCIGEPSTKALNLIEQTQEALEAGIRAVKPYRRVGAISHAVQEVAEKYNLGIVRALTGHGVGHAVHESPQIPNFGRISDGSILKPGMVLAIEPMFTLGSGEVLTEIDGWGIISADGSLSAHFEHTVIVTKSGAEIVTNPCTSEKSVIS